MIHAKEDAYRTDHKDYEGFRIRESFGSRKEAEDKEQRDIRTRERRKAGTKFEARGVGPHLRCACGEQKRCRRIAVAIHDQSGKPTCWPHQSRNVKHPTN